MNRQHRISEIKPTGVRERILNAASEILADEGVQHLSQVQTARRAGVRQSHLTYYFPTRDDLLAAVTERLIGSIAAGLSQALSENGSSRELLERLAGSITDITHMRSFIAMAVEADGDPAIRKFMKHGTRLMHNAIANAIGGERAHEDARHILTAIWGLGLYHFLIRPTARTQVTDKYLSWLAGLNEQEDQIINKRIKS